jgi:hypothetical protein
MRIIENYNVVCEKLDIQSLIDYFAIETYITNKDWLHNNVACWRSKRCGSENVYADGKWRYILFDLNYDSVFDYENIAVDMVSWAKWKSDMFAALCENEDFKKQFTLSYTDMLNTIFDGEYISELLDEYYDTYADAIAVSYRRYFGGNIENAKEKFAERISEMKEFASERGTYVLEDIALNFGISKSMGTVMLSTNDSAAGYIQLNTITPDLSSGEWSGDYFTAYPVTVTAVANDGYRFVGWKGSVESDETSMEVEVSGDGVLLEAVFEKIE